MKDLFKDMGVGTIITIWVVLLMILAGGIFMIFQPYFVNQNTKIIQHSVGNYNSYVTEMNAYINEDSKLEREKALRPELVKADTDRQVVLANMFCGRYNLVPDDVKAQLPANILQYQMAHSCAGK